MIATAIYLPCFNEAVYFGQGSPNMWHSATVICLKPFAIISLLYGGTKIIWYTE